MNSLIGFFLSYLLLYKYLSLFIIVFLAGLIIPIPVNAILLAIGAFSSQGYFDLAKSLIISISANVLGDISAYLFFNKFSHSILRDKYANKYQFFTRLEEFFKGHVGLSIFTSRIIGFFGIPVNFLSGYLKVPPYKFIFFDIMGNFFFVLIFLGIGYGLGYEWIDVSGFISDISNIIVVLVLMFIFLKLYRHIK